MGAGLLPAFVGPLGSIALSFPLPPPRPPHTGEEAKMHPTQRLPLGAHQQADARLLALRRDAKSPKISKSTPTAPPSYFWALGRHIIFI